MSSSKKCKKVDDDALNVDVENVNITSERRNRDFKEPICIHTNQVYDSCKERDCIKDQRVYFTEKGQDIVDKSINVKVKRAEVIWVYSNVEEVPFNPGYFTVDIKYFIKVTLEVFQGIKNPCVVEGLTTFDKKVILYGSQGNTKTFQSIHEPGAPISRIWRKNNCPIAVIELVDPLALTAKLVEEEECCCKVESPSTYSEIPNNICNCFDSELVIDNEGKKVLVTLGLFTIVRMERSVQLLVNAVDFCIPQKECNESSDNNPCELFNRLQFPMNEFYPPLSTANDSKIDSKNNCCVLNMQNHEFKSDCNFDNGDNCSCNCGCHFSE